MNRDDILERSRKEKEDEGQVAADNTGRKIGYLAFIVVYILLVIYSMLSGEYKTMWAIIGLFWVPITFLHYGRYRFSKEKKYLVTAIICGIASITTLLAYVIISLCN
jgi:hypothetical protein